MKAVEATNFITFLFDLAVSITRFVEQKKWSSIHWKIRHLREKSYKIRFYPVKKAFL